MRNGEHIDLGYSDPSSEYPTPMHRSEPLSLDPGMLEPDNRAARWCSRSRSAVRVTGSLATFGCAIQPNYLPVTFLDRADDENFR